MKIMTNKFQCPECNGISTAEEWDNKTIGDNCYNREMRRKYVSISTHKKGKWYTCPKCGANIRVAHIMEVTE